jgi:hypothetical protein
LRGGAIQPPLVNDQTHQRLLRRRTGPVTGGFQR